MLETQSDDRVMHKNTIITNIDATVMALLLMIGELPDHCHSSNRELREPPCFLKCGRLI